MILLIFIFLLFSDVGLIVYLFTNGYQVWAALALTFVAIAVLMMQVFSFHWHITDKTMTWKILVLHLLFLAPIHRYIYPKIGKFFECPNFKDFYGIAVIILKFERW